MEKKRKKYLGDYTVTQVAAAVGVSAATVSRILSNKIASDSNAAHKVRTFMKDKGLSLEKLRKDVRGDIYLVCDIAGDESVLPYSNFPYIYKSLMTQAESAGYNLIHSQRNAINPTLSSAKSGQIRGVIFHSHPFPLVKSVTSVAINDCLSTDEMNIVQADMVAGYIKAFRHLKMIGHDRIAFFFDHDKTKSFFPDYVRFMPYIYETAGLVWDENLFWGQKFGYGAHQPIISKALSYFMKMKKSPTAIVLHDDLYAMGFYSEIHMRGMKIPDDISVVGASDAPMCKSLPVPLSSIRTCPDAIARAALSIIADNIANPGVPARKVSICPELVVRESIKAKRG